MERKVSVEENIVTCSWFLVPTLPDGACVSNLEEACELPAGAFPLQPSSTPRLPASHGELWCRLENSPQPAWVLFVWHTCACEHACTVWGFIPTETSSLEHLDCRSFRGL